MKLLLLFTGLFLSMTIQGQTYAPYSVGKSNTTKAAVSKPDSNKNKNTKPVVVEKTPEKVNTKPKTAVSKPDSTEKKKAESVIAEKAPEAENTKQKDSYRDYMTMAIEQLHQKDYQKALDFYGMALEATTEQTVHRVLISRSILYSIMKEDEKALADLTKAIETKGTPESQLAIIYGMRARLYANNKNMDLACKDLAKAKALGVPYELIRDIDCK